MRNWIPASSGGFTATILKTKNNPVHLQAKVSPRHTLWLNHFDEAQAQVGKNLTMWAKNLLAGLDIMGLNIKYCKLKHQNRFAKTYKALIFHPTRIKTQEHT